MKKNLYSDIEPFNQILCTTHKSAKEEAYATMLKIKKLHDELKYDYNDIAVLYRNNSQSSLVEYELQCANIPFRVYSGMPFYKYISVRKMIAAYRLLDNPNDEIAFREVLFIDTYIYEKFYIEYQKTTINFIDYASNYSNDKISKLSQNILRISTEIHTKSELFDELYYSLFNDQFTSEEIDNLFEFKNLLLSTDDNELDIINSLYLDSENTSPHGVNY